MKITMHKNDPYNVSQVLKGYLQFLNYFENPNWVKDASAEDVMCAFKLGNFIENTILTFAKKEFLSQFLILLQICAKQNDVKSYSESFYTLANDQLLCKLFKTPNVNDTTLDIGVRVYTSFYSEERFRKCMTGLILTSSSIKAIADTVKTSTSLKCSIENGLILRKWSEYCKTDSMKETLINEINSCLSLYRVEETLPKLISILATGEDREIVNVIVSCLDNKMSDRSLLSKTFWTTLLTKINLYDMKQACQHYPKFAKSLLDYLKYIGSMMYGDETLTEWTLDQSACFNCKSPYFYLVIILKTLCTDSNLKGGVLNCLEDVSKYSNAALWHQIMNDITEDVT